MPLAGVRRAVVRGERLGDLRDEPLAARGLIRDLGQPRLDLG